MIIPPLCFSCGKPIADRWDEYIAMIKNYKIQYNANPNLTIDGIKISDGVKFTDDEHTIEAIVLNKLGMHKICCRRMFLCQPVHLVDMLKNREVV